MECVILAAGEGTRMRPLTKNRPKVMLPVANQPMIGHLVAAAIEAGIRSFVLVVGHHEEEIRSFFGDGADFDVSIRYTTQRRQRGTADALNAARGMVSGTFLLLNGDMIVTAGDLAGLMKVSAPAMAVYRSNHPEDFGVATLEGDIITDLVEKSDEPRGSLVNAGAYLLDEGIFASLETLGLSSRGEYELTAALAGDIEHRRLRAYELSEWFDIGAPWNLLDANEIILSRASTEILGEVEEGVTLSGTVVVGEGSRVHAGTVIEGPCIIGRNCRIGPHAYIRGATSIGDNCHIGHCTEIKNSVILSGTNLPHFNYLGDSVVGAGCNFGAGTKVANLRHDNRNVRCGGVDTGRRKFGAVIGDHVLFGINCSVNTGSLIGSKVRVAPHSAVEGLIGDNSKVGR